MTEDMKKEMKKLDKKQNKEMDVVIDMNEDMVSSHVNIEELGEAETILNNIEEVSPSEELLEKISHEREVNNFDDEKIKIKKNVIIFIIAIIIVIVAIFVGISLSNKLNLNVYKGIKLENKDLSNMSETEVLAYVKTVSQEINNRTIKIEQDDKFLIDVDSSDFSMEVDEAKTVENIMKYGRSQNILKDDIDILVAMFKTKNIDIVYTYDEGKILGIIKEVKEIVIGKTIDDSYTLNETEYKLVINKGKAGVSIDEAILKDDIIKSLSDLKTDKLNIQTIPTQPNKLDVDVIYSKVVKEPKDAYIDKSQSIPKFISHEAGLGFDKEALKTVIDNLTDNKSAEFKLDVTQPKIKLSDITWNLYEYQVSTYKTYFTTGDPNRVNNLKVALEILNGKVIMPGEVFSYNALVGSASAAQGFKEASAFVGGTIVKEVGGGICQTVSTLYNAALLADLEILQRKNHSLPVGYVPGSRDATVYYPSVDFKFKNTRNYPLKIVTTFNAGGNLTMSLYGTKEELESVVTISSKTLSYINYNTQYIQDSNLAEGVQIVDKQGTQGYISEAYKTTTKNGKEETVFLSKDTYKPVAKVVRIGTKAAAPVIAPVVPPTTPTVVTPVVPPATPAVVTPVVPAVTPTV